ncbi:MAG: hypothetical protein IKN75_08645 [Prevotella sp.]|nr:hypothetical protein [Prevotella sp.]
MPVPRFHFWMEFWNNSEEEMPMMPERPEMPMKPEMPMMPERPEQSPFDNDIQPGPPPGSPPPPFQDK